MGAARPRSSFGRAECLGPRRGPRVAWTFSRILERSRRRRDATNESTSRKSPIMKHSTRLATRQSARRRQNSRDLLDFRRRGTATRTHEPSVPRRSIHFRVKSIRIKSGKAPTPLCAFQCDRPAIASRLQLPLRDSEKRVADRREVLRESICEIKIPSDERPLFGPVPCFQHGPDDAPGLAGGHARAAAPAGQPRRDESAGVGLRRRPLRHRRCVCRPSGVRDGHLEPGSGSGRVSGRDLEPARLAERRPLAAVWAAPAVCRHQCRQHGQHDQSLHGQQESPQRRRLFARRHGSACGPIARRFPTASGRARRFRACRSSPAASRPRSAAWPITTTGATPSAGRSCSTPRPTWSSSAWASTRSSRSPTGWPPAKRSKTCETCAGWPMRWAPASRSRRPADAIVLPSYEEVKADKHKFARATKIIHQETNPLNARRLVQFHDRQAIVCNPPPLPINQDDMDRIYGLPYTRKPHPCTRGKRSRPTRSSKTR